MWAIRLIALGVFIAIISLVVVLTLLFAGATRQITEPGRCSDVCEYVDASSASAAPSDHQKLLEQSW